MDERLCAQNESERKKDVGGAGEGRRAISVGAISVLSAMYNFVYTQRNKRSRLACLGAPGGELNPSVLLFERSNQNRILCLQIPLFTAIVDNKMTVYRTVWAISIRSRSFTIQVRANARRHGLIFWLTTSPTSCTINGFGTRF